MPVLISDQAYAAIRTLIRSANDDAMTIGDDRALATQADFHLKTAEPIKADEAKDVIDYAHKTAREGNGSVDVGIVEKADRLRMALAAVKMNPAAVMRIGEDDE